MVGHTRHAFFFRGESLKVEVVSELNAPLAASNQHAHKDSLIVIYPFTSNEVTRDSLHAP